MIYFKKICFCIFFCSVIIFISSCSSTKKLSETKSISSQSANLSDEEGFENVYEVGIASYYSSVFEGKTTASGEIYSGNELTAAHKTLPFGSVVKVRNLKNKKSVIVRINDRGPSKTDRVIDLSYKAAEILDMIRDGIVNVEIIIIKN